MRPPVVPQSKLLPFHDPAFSWDTFESFFCAFLASGPTIVLAEEGKRIERRVVNARPYGRRGDNQHGIDIRAEMEGGEIWAFQCKHYRRWGTANTRIAITKCTFDAARKFLLVTREVSEDCYAEVAKHPEWTLWDARDISREFLARTETEKAARILYSHFGPGWDVRLLGLRGDGPLLTAEAKFAPFRDERHLFNHLLAHIGREQWLSDLDAFVAGKNARVLVLTGRGGLGKSRLLAKWSEGFSQRHPYATMRFVSDRPNDFTPALDAMQGKVVLVFDDAHRLEEVRRALFPDLARRSSIKLVLALRPGPLGVVRQELCDAGFDSTEIVDEPELTPLTSEQALQLAQSALGPQLADQFGQFLAEQSRECPLIAVLGGRLLRQGGIAPAEFASTQAFQTQVFDGLLREARPVEDTFGQNEVRDLLGLLALLAPVTVTPEFKERAAKFIQPPWPEHRVSEVLDALDSAGLLLVTGAGVRVVPDLLSDHLAYRVCYDRHGVASGFATRVLEQFPPEEFPVMLQHLTEAEWRASRQHGSAASSVVEPLWRWFVERFESSSFYERDRMLHQWEQIAHLQPQRTLDLGHRALKLSVTPADPLQWLHDADLESQRSVVDTIAALVKPVALFDPKFVSPCLDFLWELGRDRPKGPDGDRAHPIAMIAEIAKLEHWKPFSTLTAVLEWIERLFSGDDWLHRKADPKWVVHELLVPFFAASMEVNWTTGMTVHWKSVLVHIDRTDPIRNRVLAVCRSLLGRRSLRAALCVIPVIQRAIDYPFLGVAGNPSGDWVKRWNEERIKALAVLTEIVRDYSQPVILFQVRHALIRHLPLSDSPEFQAACRDLFLRIPNSLELRVCRAVLGNAYDEFERPMQADTRGWSERIESQWSQFLDGVADEVVAALQTIKSLCDQFQKWNDEFSLSETVPNYHPLLAALSRRHPALSLAIANSLLAQPTHPLAHAFDAVVFEATRGDMAERLRLCEAALATRCPDLSARAICCLIWWRRESEVSEAAWSLIEDAVKDAPRTVLWAILEFVKWGNRKATHRDWALLGMVSVAQDDGGLASHLASCVARLLREGGERATDGIISRILSKFDHLPSLNFQNFDYDFGEIAKKYPAAVFLLYWTRIQLRKAGELNIDPIPFRAEEKDYLGVYEDQRVAPIVTELVDGVISGAALGTDERQLLRIAILRGTNTPSTALARLLQRVESPEQLQGVVSFCVSTWSLSIVLDYPDFVREALQKACSFGSECHQTTFDEFRRKARHGARTASSGEPSGDWKKVLELMAQRAKSFSADPELGSLYTHILSDAEEEVKQMRSGWNSMAKGI